VDVGGLPYDWVNLGYQGQVLCLSLSNIREGEWGAGNIVYRKQDATALPYPNHAFEVIYSNSLLEHVGRDNQVRVADEIRRVGQRYWVQVPCRTFPLEPHYRALFFHQLPRCMRHWVARYWTPLVKKENNYLGEVDTIYLLRSAEIQALFPDAEIMHEKLFGLTKSLIAVKT